MKRQRQGKRKRMPYLSLSWMADIAQQTERERIEADDRDREKQRQRRQRQCR